MNGKKNKVVPVSMPEEMNNEIAKNAAEQNMSKSAYIRSIMLDSVEYRINRPTLNVILIGLIEHLKETKDKKVRNTLNADIENIISLLK
ncbi:hypothetical protein [[Clostridium] fimetarium]|uniref:Ribbon-helix-helix protein, copG family n=1 Tax=[Clostridium] fimetarium TaxID=99656 RepID=A0A1I0PZI0_9FIRM|nr:hypothetical protein [[Clostridium] fimetarium]SEW20122.1 hypothetical protein SAMN05421659_106174 [[Clostridium] fimetarium]